MLRIYGGKYKNTYLDVVDKTSRPITERIRQSIFETLKPYIEKTNVLDLFAGSGVTGIEALSLGAQSCTFVDISYDVGAVIKKNIEKAKVTEPTKIVVNSFHNFIKNSNEIFDIIFLDPPFDYQGRIDLNSLSKLTHKDSIVVFRTAVRVYKRKDDRILSEDFEEVYSKKFNQSEVVFYRPKL